MDSMQNDGRRGESGVDQPSSQQQKQESISKLEDRIKALEEQNNEEKIKELKKDIEVLDLWLTVASENGVFADKCKDADKSKSTPAQPGNGEPKPGQPGNKECNDIPKSFNEAQEYLKLVWNRLYNAEMSRTLSIGDCETCLSKVFEFYNRSISELSRVQKFLINGGHIIAYLTGMLTFILLATLVWNIHNYLNISVLDSEYGFIIYNATVIGLVGGIVRSLYNIVHEVRLRVFRRPSWAEYTMAPFIGGLFAFIITISILAGLIVDLLPTQLEEQRGEQPTQQQQQNIRQPYGLYAIAFTSGLFWKNTIDRLKSIVGDKDKVKEVDGKITPIE